MGGPRLRRKPRFEIRQTEPQKGQPPEFYVCLVSANNEILSTSETFPDARTAADNVDAQKRAAILSMAPAVRRRRP